MFRITEYNSGDFIAQKRFEKQKPTEQLYMIYLSETKNTTILLTDFLQWIPEKNKQLNTECGIELISLDVIFEQLKIFGVKEIIFTDLSCSGFSELGLEINQRLTRRLRRHFYNNKSPTNIWL